MDDTSDLPPTIQLNLWREGTTVEACLPLLCRFSEYVANRVRLAESIGLPEAAEDWISIDASQETWKIYESCLVAGAKSLDEYIDARLDHSKGRVSLNTIAGKLMDVFLLATDMRDPTTATSAGESMLAFLRTYSGGMTASPFEIMAERLGHRLQVNNEGSRLTDILLALADMRISDAAVATVDDAPASSPDQGLPEDAPSALPARGGGRATKQVRFCLPSTSDPTQHEEETQSEHSRHGSAISASRASPFRPLRHSTGTSNLSSHWQTEPGDVAILINDQNHNIVPHAATATVSSASPHRTLRHAIGISDLSGHWQGDANDNDIDILSYDGIPDVVLDTATADGNGRSCFARLMQGARAMCSLSCLASHPAKGPRQ